MGKQPTDDVRSWTPWVLILSRLSPKFVSPPSLFFSFVKIITHYVMYNLQFLVQKSFSTRPG